MKNPSFSSNVQPNIIYTPFPKIESYLGATGFAICFQISFLHELYFPSTLDKIITRSIRFLATTRLHIFSLRGLFTVQVNFLSRVHGNTCRTQSAADRNLNAVGLMWGGGTGSAPSLFPPPFSGLSSLPALGSLPFARSPLAPASFSLLSFFGYIANKLHRTNFGQLPVAVESFFFLSTFCCTEDNFSLAIVLRAACFFASSMGVFTVIANHRLCQFNSWPVV